MWRRVRPSTWQELCLAGPGSSVQCWAQDVSPDAWQVCCLFECGLNLALWCMLTDSLTSYVDLQKWILQHFRCHLLMHHCQSVGMFRLLHSALHSKEFLCCICVSFCSCVQMWLSLHFLWIDFFCFHVSNSKITMGRWAGELSCAVMVCITGVTLHIPGFATESAD